MFATTLWSPYIHPMPTLCSPFGNYLFQVRIWKIKRCSGIDLFAIPYGIDPKRLESYRIDRVCAKGTGSILERSGYGIDPGTLGVWDRSWNAPSTGTIPERSGNAQGFRIDPGSLRVFWIDPRTLKPTESILVGQASFWSPNTRFIYTHVRWCEWCTYGGKAHSLYIRITTVAKLFFCQIFVMSRVHCFALYSATKQASSNA